ncbi:MAG: DTW domain-containing protein [Gammaproteobacteria bacterium]|nr:DTW domain-containing protein [Gammaproteobacteria bacterium]
MSRSFCYRCQRVEAACFCHKVIQIDNPLPVIVLQHPDESRINKGSAIIAKLCLKNYQCWQGEDFSDNAALNSLIMSAADQTAVLYPAADALILTDYYNAMPAQKKIKQLIVIDASWRKARKIWSLSTNLQGLTCLKLGPELQSNYRIRKVPAAGYLSTIEAIACSLSVFDQAADKYQPLLDLFASMIDFQIDKMGQKTYQKNYTDN